MRELYKRYGYSEVVTPLIYKTDLWKTSGHYEAFHDDMFLMNVHDGEYGVKPMNCPGHCYLFGSRKYSYRDLPIRFADFSRLHRFEPSGVLSGLTRVRSFAQDDAHIYCTPEQLDGELEQFVAMTKEVYKVFGFDRIEVTLQTRPEKFSGRIELWDAAEAGAAALSRTLGLLGASSCRAKGLSMARRSASISAMSWSARGRWRRCRSIAPCLSASVSSMSPPMAPKRRR